MATNTQTLRISFMFTSQGFEAGSPFRGRSQHPGGLYDYVLNMQGQSLVFGQFQARAPIPAEIWMLTNLERLWLYELHLTTLPSEVGNLTNLKELNLWENRLTTLPAEIGKLTKLRKLKLRNNQLTSIPPEIKKLTKLEELDITINKFTAKDIQRLEHALPSAAVQHD